MLTVQSQHFSFLFQDDGRFCIQTAAGLLENACVKAAVNHQEQNLCFRPESVTAGTGKFIAETSCGRFILEVEAEKDLKLTLSCELKEYPREIDLTPLCLPMLKVDHAVAQGRRMGRCANLHFPCVPVETEYLSHFYSAVRIGAKYLLFSTPLRKRLHTEFHGTVFQNGIEKFSAVSSTCHEDSLYFSSDALTITTGDNLFDMICSWSDANVEVKKACNAVFAPGWNSWDYYRWTVSEEQILANAEFIRRDPVLSKYIKRIIVDDGWQYCYGDWEPNHFFPHGMKYLARELARMGFEPGLWLAPALVEPHSQIAQLHPDWCAMGESGQACLSWECMGRHAAVLDPTVPAVKEHIFQLFSRYVSYGYKYFKLDFLYGAMMARQYHDRSVPHSDMIRLILEQVYNAVAGQALIMGCNFTFDSGNKYVDSVRIGRDIHSRWENIKQNSTALAINTWGTGRQWLSDPDFSLCRSLDTSDDPDLNTLSPNAIFGTLDGPYLPGVSEYRQVDAGIEQIKILLSLVLVSGGAINLSDRMDRLNERGLALARKLVSSTHGEQGIPLDLGEREYASSWLQNLPDGRKRLLLINWDDSAQTVLVDARKYGITAQSGTDFWNDRPIMLSEGKIVENLPAHSCILLEFS